LFWFLFFNCLVFSGLHACFCFLLLTSQCWALPLVKVGTIKKGDWCAHVACGMSVITSQPPLVNLHRLQACVCPLQFREQSPVHIDRKGHYGHWCSRHLEWLQLSGSETTNCAEESFL
jgi:hypothetical protein